MGRSTLTAFFDVRHELRIDFPVGAVVPRHQYRAYRMADDPALSLFTGRNAWWSGTRMLAIGVAAGTVTFMIGKMLGVTLG